MSKEISDLDKAVKTVELKTDCFEKNLAVSIENSGVQFQKVNESVQALNQKSDAQFSKTVGMGRTYDAILEEQKKKTVDTAGKDKSYLEAKNNAIASYNKGSYSASYDGFRKLTQTFTDDMECRLYKAKSLYYKNRADSSSYAQILEDIRILKQNGDSDTELLEIEKSILAEKEGFDE
ncbi:hypothetical protein [uncultured Treponema sp.]|uniref:hypothetical protein n=1 Tax=uncultured Treponema sp. TaxID=162155 RepID=UPI0028061568|nr:hypothetical protein [uncultured Treponema sp.]